MLIDLVAYQRQCFLNIIDKVKQSPETYLNFEDIADVYHAKWLQTLPPMCRWYVSGLDDGAEEFYISIIFEDEKFTFSPYQAK